MSSNDVKVPVVLAIAMDRNHKKLSKIIYRNQYVTQ